MIDLTDLMRGTVDAGPEWQQFPADTYPFASGSVASAVSVPQAR